jgi:hypothetical protein
MQFTDEGLSVYLSIEKAGNGNPDHYAYSPKEGKWKLPLADGSGKITAAQVGMAAAALSPGGFRGQQVQIPAEALPAVRAKVRAAWRRVNSDKKDEEMPISIRKESPMDQDQLEQKLTEMENQLTEAVAKVDTLEAIGKAYQELETEDRDAFATLSKEQQEEFVKADTTDERKEEILSKAREAIDEADAKSEPEVPEEVRKQLDDISKALDAEKAKSKELASKVAKSEDLRFTAECIAKAEQEYPNLPGTKEEKGAVLKSLHCPCLSKEQRESVEKLLASGNEALGNLTTEVGKGTSPATSGWGAIEKKAVELYKDEKLSKEQAVAKYLDTPEGSESYTQYLQEQSEQ